MTGTGTGLDFVSMEPFYPFRINLAVTPAANQNVYAYIWGDDETLPNGSTMDYKSIYIYVYNGTSWSQLFHHHGYNAKEWMAFTVSPVNSGEYYFYANMGTYGTHNLSTTPIKVSNYISSGVYADGHVLEMQPNVSVNPLLFFGHHAGISLGDVSDINNPEWEFINTGIQNMLHWSFDDSEFESDIVITANQDCFSYFYEDSNWGFISGGGDSYSARSSKVNSDLFFASSGDNSLVSYSRASGNTSYESSKRPYDGANSSLQTIIVKTFSLKSFPNENYDFFSFAEVYRRNFDSPSGQTPYTLWDFDSDIGKIEPAMWKRQITELDFCQSNTNYIYVATGGVYSEDPNGLNLQPGLFRTTIGGNDDNYSGVDAYDQITYPGISSTEFPVISGIAVHPFFPDRVWISMIGYDNIDMRVAYTEDGGDTWENADPTNSLPELPVNGIVYQYGSNDALYLATDVGVYYKDASMTDWEEYGVFPHVRVTELKINYCQNKLRAATFGRTVWEGDLLPSTSLVCYSVKNGETLVWDKQKTLRTGVRIEAGGELIITGEVTMPKGGQIIVEVGGKLTIDGGKITNGCGELWQGIQVWGTSTGAQNPQEQGWVSIIDGTIENAIRGIVANKYESSGSPTPGYTGGVIQARGTTFKNCITAVQFDSYEPFSASWFNDCQFVVDADFAAIGTGLYPKWEMVKIAGHRGTQFINSDFVNGAPEEFDTEERGTGILSINGGFSVTDGSSFTDLYYGIYGMDVLAQNTFYVHDANFNSYRGVYMGSCYNNQIDGSSFTIPQSVTGDNMQSYGLYMEYSTGYAIEDNTFTSVESAPTGIGVYVNNSGTDNNEIYRNEFSNLQYSIVAQDINRKNTIGGLVIKCNYFDNTTSDVVVVAGKGSETIDHGIAKNQGALSTDPTQMAGNRFYYNTTSIDFDDLNNGLNHFNYYYPNNTIFGSGNVNPLDITNNTVTKYGVPYSTPWSYSNGCPTHETGGGTLLTKMAVADEKADSTASVLAVLVDNGDTPELASEVDQSTPAQTVDLYNELMATSPYLSDSVVESAIVKEDVLPNALLRDIMVANAHSSKSELLMNTLDSRWDPMPDYMKAQILQGRSLVSLKEETESRLGAFNLDKARALYGLSRMFMYDTMNPSTAVDSLIDLLSTEYTLSAQYQWAMLELGKGEYTLGSSVLSNIPSHITLTSSELTQHQQMVDYYNWLTSVKQSQGNILNPSASQRQQLWNMAMADSSKAGVYARNLLVALGDTAYHEPIILPDLYKSTQALANFDELLNVEGPSLLNVFPNPASGYVILEYKLESDAKASVTVSDLRGTTIETRNTTGRQDQLTMITRDWVPGVYVASLKVNGKLTESIKFTVVK